jgi:hypothetical protein
MTKVKYTENIKVHAFITNNYMNGYFDFAFSFYEKVLFRQINKHTLSDDIVCLFHPMMNIIMRIAFRPAKAEDLNIISKHGVMRKMLNPPQKGNLFAQECA